MKVVKQNNYHQKMTENKKRFHLVKLEKNSPYFKIIFKSIIPK